MFYVPLEVLMLILGKIGLWSLKFIYLKSMCAACFGQSINLVILIYLMVLKSSCDGLKDVFSCDEALCA